MKNELLTIGPLTLYGYGFMIAVGVLAAYFTAEYRARKLQLEYEHIFYLVLWCLLGGFACAKLLFWITEWRTIAQNPAFILHTISDGFVVFGGILGGILAGYLYCRVKKLEFLKYFDLIMPSIALAQGFGRIGCLLAGCCYGRETDSALSITFRESEFAPNGVALVPTQIYSSLLDFAHFFLLLYVARKKSADGQVAACYLIFYSIGRFILEFFRGDFARGSVGMLSTSQFIAIFTGIAGVGMMLAVSRKKNKIGYAEMKKMADYQLSFFYVLRILAKVVEGFFFTFGGKRGIVNLFLFIFHDTYSFSAFHPEFSGKVFLVTLVLQFLSGYNKERNKMDRDNMIFDDVFRTLLEKTPRLAIPLINEVFGTAYDENTEITQLRNEHQTKDGRRITDSSLQIQDRIYHIECQSTQDSAMVIRMVEYDFYIALDHAILTEGKYRIEFPRTCVLYLRHDLNTKDELNLEIVFPHGEAVNYRVPVVKVQNYTKDVIFQKKLLFLLPFYVMRYEKEAERLEEDDEKLAELLEEYEEIRIRLENALGDGERRREYMELLEMIRKISDYIFRKSGKTKKGVSDRMGGQVLELEADKIYDRMEARYNAMVSAKEAEMSAKEAEMSAKEAKINAKETEINEKETQISAKETEINAKEAEMSAKETKISAKETEINAKETEINAKEAEMSAKETEINAKETEINAKETEISAKETEMSAKEAEMSAKETKISAREEELKRRERESQVNRDKMLVHTLHFIAGFSPEKIADKMNYTLDKVTMLLEA